MILKSEELDNDPRKRGKYLNITCCQFQLFRVTFSVSLVLMTVSDCQPVDTDSLGLLVSPSIEHCAQRVAASKQRTLTPPDTWSCPISDLYCSNAETILSLSCHVYGPFEFRTPLGTSILLPREYECPPLYWCQRRNDTASVLWYFTMVHIKKIIYTKINL